jgi:hypothetical protein
LELLRDLSRHYAKKMLEQTPPRGSNPQVDMVMLNGNLVDLHKKHRRISLEDPIHHPKARGRAQTPLPKIPLFDLQHQMQWMP